MIDGGLGETQVNTLLSSLNIPAISSTTLKRYERKVGNTIESVAKESCQESIVVEKMLTQNEKSKRRLLNFYYHVNEFILLVNFLYQTTA